MVFILLKFAIQDFMDDREFKNLSSETLKSYSGTLEEFHTHCIENKVIDTSDVRPNIIKNYLIYCQKERKNNPSSINHKLRNLKIFFVFFTSI